MFECVYAFTVYVVGYSCMHNSPYNLASIVCLLHMYIVYTYKHVEYKFHPSHAVSSLNYINTYMKWYMKQITGGLCCKMTTLLPTFVTPPSLPPSRDLIQ
jgi:hypothetical protein